MEALLKCDSLSPAGNALDTEAIERTVLEIASSQRYSALLTTAKNARLGLTFSLFESDSPMSNFYNCNTVIDGFVWPCLEHYFQHEKAVMFNDTETAAEIKNSSCPEIAKWKGRAVRNFDRASWARVSGRVLTKGVWEKFTQNGVFRDMLLATGDSVLVDCFTDDLIWANGLEISSSDVADPAKWPGGNRLGKILVLVREHFRTQAKAESIDE